MLDDGAELGLSGEGVLGVGLEFDESAAREGAVGGVVDGDAPGVEAGEDDWERRPLASGLKFGIWSHLLGILVVVS